MAELLKVSRKNGYYIPAKLVQDEQLKLVDMFVWGVLDHYAHKEGKCRLTMTELAARIGYEKQTTTAALKRLEAAGYITTIARRGPSGGTDIFVDYEKVV